MRTCGKVRLSQAQLRIYIYSVYAMKKHFSLIDPLRFFAAMWVMNYHYLLAPVSTPGVHWYRYGNLGVQIFFVISGFVIVQSLTNKSLSEFATGRFLRLFPLFWILCTLTYIVTILLPDTTYSIHFSDYLRSMTMLSDVFEKNLGHSTLVDSSYWTLTVELIFYVAIGTFVHFFSHKRLPYFFAAFLCISMAAFALHVDKEYFAKMLLVNHAAYFVFGGMLALIATVSDTSKTQQIFNYCFLIFAGFYATLIQSRALSPYETTNPHDGTIVMAIHVAMFIGIPCLVYLSKFVRDKSTVQCLGIVGALTYPLYLLHQRIGNILIDYTIHHSAFAWFTVVIAMEVFIVLLAVLLSVLDSRIRARISGKANYARNNLAVKTT